jgi:uncharacterized RDD family membrane protein YckC
MPIGQKICDMCGGGPAPANKPWTPPPQEAAPVQLASSADSWNYTAPPPAQVADQGITLPSYVTVANVRAAFWMRAIAYLVDAAVVGIPSYALAVVVLQQGLAGRTAVQLLLSLIYFAYFWSAPEKGQTLGMSLFNLHVVKADGSYLDASRAFIRWIGFFLSQSALGLGLLWAAFDANKQGWHDKIAGTYVIRAAS